MPALNYEYSRPAVSGDTTADRELKFWKPSLTIDWKPGGGWHTHFSIRRTVAQLNFFDFVSSPSSATTGSMPAMPTSSRSGPGRSALTVDRPLFGDGPRQARPRLRPYQHASGPDPDLRRRGWGFDAPGNIGTGKRLFANLTIDAPLDRFGRASGPSSTAMLQRTRVEDPINGELRNFSDYFPDWQWNVEVRRDAGPLSYGFDIFDRDRFTFFRFNEDRRQFQRRRRSATAFVEYRPSRADDADAQRQQHLLGTADPRPTVHLAQPLDSRPRRQRISRARPHRTSG